MGDKADIILVNGRFATLDSRSTFQSAIAISNGRLAAIGTNREVLDYRKDRTIPAATP